MTDKLPEPLAAYFAAKNRHEIDAMLAPFAEDAVVKDEGATMTGRTAIREWMEETTRKYAVTVDVREVVLAGENVKVRSLVSGNFPGSPATLGYSFTLAGDRIAHLEIG